MKFKPLDCVEIKSIRGPSLLVKGMIGRVDNVRAGNEVWKRQMGCDNIVDVSFDLYPGTFPMSSKELRHVP